MATNPALPFDYMARLDRQNRRRQQASNDPVGDALRGIQTQEQVDTLKQAPAPDRVARTTRLAREAQDTPFNVEGREDEVQTSLDAQRFGSLAERYPAIGRFAQANPRGAAMARDDHESLGLLGTAWDFLKNAPGRIVGGIVYGVPQGINSIYGAVEDLNRAVQSPIYAGLSALSQASGVRALDPTAMLEYDRQRRSQRDSYFSGLSESVKTEYRGANAISEGLLTGTDSVGQTLAAIATGNPSAAAGVLGGMVGAQAYGDARAKGWDAARALRYGVVQGSIEGVTEKIPASTLLELITRKLPFGKAFVREFGQEMTGEQFATFFQDLSDYSQDPANRDKTIGDFWRERPQAALSTALAVAGGTSVTTGGIALTQRAADATVRFSKRRSEAEAARRDAEGLDKLDKALGASKLKARDADALRQVLTEQAKDAGTQHVFIPAEAVRAYQQSDGYDGSQDPWASLDWQDVELAGGDIVMPIEEALTKVVGTPAWDAVKADVRLTAGGMSLREADDFDAAFADIQDTLSEQAKAQDVADQAGESVREKLVGELALKFGESYTADVARKYAELAVQRAATRAARQGSELTAGEFANLDVRQVLPEGVAQAVQSDTLDLVVNAMRQGKPTEVGQGESLLQWLRARGGINDTGGDFASMGLPRRLIRTSQRDMLQVGSGDYGVDSTLRAAVSDGFFPDLAGVEGQAGPSQLDTQILLDAISRELAGEKVFRETRADPMRKAGEELRGILGDAGLDPATASDADIRAAVAAFEAGATEGRGYEQAAFHGSPHIFDKFSLDAIGTGEGAQAYGWGLYFAGRKEIAKFYRDQLADPTLDGRDMRTNELQAWSIYSGQGKDIDAAIAEAQRQLDEYAATNPMRLHLDDARLVVATLKSWKKDGLPKFDGEGRLYEVEIPDEGGYLLWDKPLSEQPENVKAGLAKAIKQLAPDANIIKVGATIIIKDKHGNELIRAASMKEAKAWVAGYKSSLGAASGQQLYLRMRQEMASDKDASLALYDAGIAGIKYLDGGSRSSGDGSYNYVVFDDSRVSIRAYEQEARGRIIFDEAKRTIELFQSRNLSTPIHELGHMWLEELQADALMPDAPDQVKEDWATVAKWFADNGHEVGQGPIPTEAHELWARGTERYIMEGKAPSPLLTRLFETMRAWLVNIYRTVARLNTPITPEIREVFDRLLATDEEIAAAREEQALTALFKNMPEGMRPEEFTAYQAQVAEAKASASSTLLDKTMRTIRRQNQERYRGYRKSIRAEETARIDGSPLFIALSTMKVDRIDKTWLTDNFGADVTDLLPVRVPPLYREGGADPEAVAELAGYPSARDMIEALIGAEKAHRQDREGGDQRSMRERAIDTATDAEFNRRYGDPFNDGSIEREALAAIHTDRQGEVMASELRILSRSTGQRPTPYRAARTWARRRVREGVVAEQASLSAIAQHRRNSAKAGRAAEAAILAGDAQEALRQKQAQMLSSALLAEAKEAYDAVSAAEQRLSKLAKVRTRKSVDQDYLEQAQALLENVELRKRSQLSIERAGKWEAWAQAREAEGYDVLTPPSFEAMLGKTNYTRLPVEDFLTLDEQVKQILHLGRLKRTLLDNEDARQWDAIIGEAVEGAGNLRGKPPADLAEPGWRDALAAGALAADAALLKMETVFDWLDGGNSNGVFNRVAFRPIAEAQAREQDMLVDYYARIKARFEAVPAEVTRRWNDRITAPWMDVETDRPMVLNRKQAVAMALNIGNEGNLQRLADGYSVNPSAIEGWLGEMLTAEEWGFVQGVWDDIDTLWPEIAALERKVNGVAPDKVEPRSFDMPHGTMRGGYYPAVYDSTRDYRAEENRGRESDLFAGNFTKATTRSSSTKERAEKVNRPILLDLGVINRHLGEVIHDITHREAVINANRMLSNERVRRAIDAALGREIGKQLRPWVKHVANSWALERAGNEGIGKWLGKLRANVTAVGMGLRATTMVTQIAGYSNSFEAVGEQWVAPQIARFAASPIELTRFVMERSGELRHRMDTLDRDIASQLAIVAASNPATKAWAVAQEAKAFMFHGIGYMDRLVSIPTWLGAYNKALAAGMSEQDAAYAGDKAVRISQGAGAAKDLAAVQRNTGRWGEALKLMTMFYSFFSAQYQRQRTLGRDALAKDTRKTRSPRLVARAFWLLVVPPLLVEVLRASVGADAGPDDDEWWAQWVMRKLLANSLGPIPVARDLFEPSWQAAIKGEAYNPSISPLQRVFDVTFKNAGNVGKLARGEETKRATKDALEFAGYTTGLVPGQVASAVQFAVDVGVGEADPQGLQDWTQGLLTGKLEE